MEKGGDKHMVIQIPAHEVPNMDVRPLLEKALSHAHGEVAYEDVINDCAMGNKQLWVVSDKLYRMKAAAITELSDYPRMRVARVLFLGGNGLPDWSDELREAIEKWARQWGAYRVDVLGRKGWERILDKHGYTPLYVHLGRVIDYGEWR